jgi:hypothetical protein
MEVALPPMSGDRNFDEPVFRTMNVYLEEQAGWQFRSS